MVPYIAVFSSRMRDTGRCNCLLVSDLLNTLPLEIVKTVSFFAVLFILHSSTIILLINNKMTAPYIPSRLDGKVALVTGSGRGIVLTPPPKTTDKYYCAQL